MKDHKIREIINEVTKEIKKSGIETPECLRSIVRRGVIKAISKELVETNTAMGLYNEWQNLTSQEWYKVERTRWIKLDDVFELNEKLLDLNID